MTLVALFAMTTGAWADEATITLKCGTTEKTYENVTLPWSSTGDILKEVISDYKNVASNIDAITGGDGKVVKYGNEQFTVTGTFSGEATVVVSWYNSSKQSATITVTAPGPLLTLNEAKTEATMESMPTYDVTIDYELVRDMSVLVPVRVGDGKDGFRIRVKKNEQQQFEPAEMTLQAMMALFNVRDSLEHANLAFYGQDAVCALSIYAVGDNDQPTGDAIAFQALTPGRYVAMATAKEGSAYDGVTDYSNIFQLYEGFPVVVPATEGEVGETVDLGTLSFYTEEFNLKLDPANQANLYTLTAIDGSTVTATKVDVVPAGMPFFVLNEENVDQTVTLIPADNNEVATETPKPIAEFLGTATDLTFTQDDMDGDYNYYVLYKGAFVWVKDPGTLKAGKCYLRVLKSQPTTSRRIVFGDATGVKEVIEVKEVKEVKDNSNGK